MIEFLIEELLNNQFIDKISDECADYVMNLGRGEISGYFDNFVDYFDNFVDYATLDVIDNVILNDFKEEIIDGQKEISGLATVLAEIEGIVHWNGEDESIGFKTVPLHIEFVFYMLGEKAEEFSIISIC